MPQIGLRIIEPLVLTMDPLKDVINWIAAYGIFGLVAIGVAERFVPVLPSYGLLVAIGIATAAGDWSVGTAVLGTVAGSLAGSLALYCLAFALGEARSYRFLIGSGRLLGLSSTRVKRAMSAFRLHQLGLAFGSQLVPTVRLISPVIAGLFRADARAFALATLSGIFIWNSLFISVGLVAAVTAPAVNFSALAVIVLVLLIATEAILGLTWRWLHPPAPLQQASSCSQPERNSVQSPRVRRLNR